MFTCAGLGARTLVTSCQQSIRVGQVLNYGSGTLTIVGFRTVSGRTQTSCAGGNYVAPTHPYVAPPPPPFGYVPPPPPPTFGYVPPPPPATNVYMGGSVINNNYGSHNSQNDNYGYNNGGYVQPTPPPQYSPTGQVYSDPKPRSFA